MHVLSGHTERVTGVARLGRDRLASASVDGTLRLWDLETGNVLHELILPSPACCLGAVGEMDARSLTIFVSRRTTQGISKRCDGIRGRVVRLGKNGLGYTEYRQVLLG